MCRLQKHVILSEQILRLHIKILFQVVCFLYPEHQLLAIYIFIFCDGEMFSKYQILDRVRIFFFSVGTSPNVKVPITIPLCMFIFWLWTCTQALSVRYLHLPITLWWLDSDILLEWMDSERFYWFNFVWILAVIEFFHIHEVEIWLYLNLFW